MGRVAREIFRRRNEFTAVRPIRLTARVTLEPGTDIDKARFRLHHLKNLYLRRRIGVRNSAWVKAMLEARDDAHARPEVTGTAEPVIEPIIEELVLPLATPGAADPQIIGEITMALSQLVELAMADSDLSTEAWNELPEEERAHFLGSVCERLETLQADVTEDLDTDETDQGETGNDADKTSDATIDEIPKEEGNGTSDDWLDGDDNAKEVGAVEPIKIGSQWTLEGIDRKFSSKKKALEHLNGQQTTEDK